MGCSSACGCHQVSLRRGGLTVKLVNNCHWVICNLACVKHFFCVRIQTGGTGLQPSPDSSLIHRSCLLFTMCILSAHGASKFQRRCYLCCCVTYLPLLTDILQKLLCCQSLYVAKSSAPCCSVPSFIILSCSFALNMPIVVSISTLLQPGLLR